MMNRGSDERLHVVILMPVFRDWDVAAVLCQQIDQQLAQLDGVDVRIFLVDDGSPEPVSGWTSFDPAHISRIDVLQLRRNLGHQRAIAMGLCVIQADIDCDAVLVMDADGEDRPEDVIRLINHFRDTRGTIVFAGRQRRVEGLVFRIGYWWYRLLHQILTGVVVREGNFSIIPRTAADRLVTMSELWNHYAGAIHRSKLRYLRIPVDRGQRLGGQSHMDFVALVIHGLAGIGTFYEVVATRILIASVASVGALVLALAAVIGIRVETRLAIPGWATYTTGLLLLLVLQFTSSAFSLVFLLVNTRLNVTFIPARDYRNFIEQARPLWSGTE
jgi:hypothetical protein